MRASLRRHRSRGRDGPLHARVTRSRAPRPPLRRLLQRRSRLRQAPPPLGPAPATGETSGRGGARQGTSGREPSDTRPRSPPAPPPPPPPPPLAPPRPTL